MRQQGCDANAEGGCTACDKDPGFNTRYGLCTNSTPVHFPSLEPSQASRRKKKQDKTSATERLPKRHNIYCIFLDSRDREHEGMLVLNKRFPPSIPGSFFHPVAFCFRGACDDATNFGSDVLTPLLGAGSPQISKFPTPSVSTVIAEPTTIIRVVVLSPNAP